MNRWLETHFGDTGEKAVFFTIKFHRKRGSSQWAPVSINERYAEKLLSNFLNRLDRAYLSRRAVKKGIRLQRAIFKHVGFSGENLHFHGVILCEGDAEDFLSKCTDTLKKLFSNNLVDLERSQFEIADSIPRAAFYSGREVRKIGLDSWMWKYTNIPEECSSAESTEQARDQQNVTLKLREERLRHQPQEIGVKPI